MSLRAENIADIPGISDLLSSRYFFMLSLFSLDMFGVCSSSRSMDYYFETRGSSAFNSPISVFVGLRIKVGVWGSVYLEDVFILDYLSPSYLRLVSNYFLILAGKYGFLANNSACIAALLLREDLMIYEAAILGTGAPDKIILFLFYWFLRNLRIVLFSITSCWFDPNFGLF